MHRLALPAAFLLALVLAPLPSPALSAQEVDLSGEWTLSVEVNGNVTTPTLTLVQQADTLSGTYDSETLGRANVRGLVDGNGFTVRFNASMQGQPIPVVYEGELQEDGTIAGSIELADGAISGTFTGRREGGLRPSDVQRE